MANEQRVALGGILTECNQFGGEPIDITWFERYELRRGDEVLDGAEGVVGGMLDVLRQRRCSIAPLLFASTCPGGPLTVDCYRQLKSELLMRLQAALPLDGVLLPLHGAAAVAGGLDLEADLISAVREIVGRAIPLVATLDLHAHISPPMVAGADALVAWETYPHRDAFSTGQRGARLLCDALAGRCKPAMAYAKVPLITSAIYGSTEGDDAFAQVMRLAKSYEGQDGILSTGAILVHPYLDFAGMGSGGLVVADGDIERAVDAATHIARDYWQRRFALEPELLTPEDAVQAGAQIQGGGVVLVEAADCCGGGAVGDSVATLPALLASGKSAVLPLVDAAAATRCHRAGVGAELGLELGHHHDPNWGRPLAVKARVKCLSDGRFRYRGGIWHGIEGEMAAAAVLEIGLVQIALASHPTYEWAGEQFAALGLQPERFHFIVAKNPMNYRMAFAGARTVYVLDTPGPTTANVRRLPFKEARPFFPLDADLGHIEDISPVVLRGHIR